MRAYTLDHLSDRNLLRALTALVARERATTAELLAHIAEVDARRLYAPAGYASMHAYCVGELRLSEDAAAKRIQAARTARRFPAIFDALAEGRLHLSAVVLLAPCLRQENAAEMLGAAAFRTKAEIEQLLARRFPMTEEIGLVSALPTARDPGAYIVAVQQDAGPAVPGVAESEHAPGHVGVPAGATGAARSEHAPGHVVDPKSGLAPIAHQRFALHVTINQATHEKLRHAQALLSHRLPSGDLATTLDLALDALVEKLEKRKFAKTDKPRSRRRTSPNPRHIPAHVKRAVWQRDGGRCTFVSATGHRCNARRFLEFDHVEPVARGGRASVAGVRLRCRAHNQLEAERVFGAGFMNAKRLRAGRGGGKAPGRHATRVGSAREAPVPRETPRPVHPDHDADVAACLRSLGVRAGEARHAMELGAAIPAATLEERVRATLRFLGPGARPPI